MVRKWPVGVCVLSAACLSSLLLSRTVTQAAQTAPSGGTLSQRAATGAGGPTSAEAPAARQEARSTIWDGVYAEDQAKRGEQSYNRSCAKCHAEDLLGSTNAPALVGQPFFARFDRTSVDDVLDAIRRTMPQEAPDTLGVPVYADIVSYLFRSNGAPGGKTELPTDRAKLREILVTSR